jgi:hypothetical protein
MEFNTTWIEQNSQTLNIGLSYLRFLSDDFGVWQHTTKNKIDRTQGYALDDVTRALWVANAYRQNDLREIYFNFILKACLHYPQPVNFFDYQRKPVLARGFSLDALGQVVWVIHILENQQYRPKETEIILEKIKPYFLNTNDLRPIAYQLLSTPDPNLAFDFTQKITKLLKLKAEENWYWPEDSLTYANAVFPWAMFKIAPVLNDQLILESAQKMLDFINQNCNEQGRPSAIGNKGWYPRGGIKQKYDQQPLDIAYLVLANLQAYQALQQMKPNVNNQLRKSWYYLEQARFFYSWYWGNNLKNQLMLNLSKESVYDGLTDKGYSENQGAENIITFLMAQFELKKYLKLV